VPCIKIIEVEAKRALQTIEQSFAEAIISHIKHTPFALEGGELPQTTLIGLDLPVIAHIGIIRRRKR
jgi:hypothetical protein